MGTKISEMTATGSAPADSEVAIAHNGANYKITPINLFNSASPSMQVIADGYYNPNVLNYWSIDPNRNVLLLMHFKGGEGGLVQSNLSFRSNLSGGFGTPSDEDVCLDQIVNYQVYISPSVSYVYEGDATTTYLNAKCECSTNLIGTYGIPAGENLRITALYI